MSQNSQNPPRMSQEQFKEAQNHQPSKKVTEPGKESFGPSSTALGGVGAYAGNIPETAVKHEPTTGDKVQGAVNKAVGTAKEYIGSAVNNENLKNSGAMQRAAGDKQMQGIDTS
ncbi:5058_t:CDS:2 [Paraglomus occultum]|uniref:5058_t:CDS:1 n=1 Tax=Paraglomus occultum TaxID=144539 RepID=A0A9N8ZAP3_9GLOM|nr:5058_t:CDS:2 [Paraglomus occultum]